tara:strand:- start:203 stop:742 length:540 start_codon:yes stop_codon:yes gene_type:complete
MVQISKEPSFDRPIPGQALTAELGSRPWQSPPQYTTVDEAIDFYMERMSSEDAIIQAADILEMGVPVTTLANTMQMANVMEGVHTIDVGMLVLPIIMEMLMLIGDSSKIEYQSGLDNPNKVSAENKTRDTLLAKISGQYKSMLDEKDFEDMQDEDIEDEDIEEAEETTEEPAGLMARRN